MNKDVLQKLKEQLALKRPQGRELAQLREIHIEPRYVRNPPGSALVRYGSTWVLCTASIEERVPPFLVGKNQGWVTAEYSMLPGSGIGRVSRTQSGRSKEIDRLIGRSLRAAVDLKRLGNRTITIDCDVIQSDGGTRTAAITGGYVALALAVHHCIQEKLLTTPPFLHMVAAISVGIVHGQVRLDLDYEEDSQADVDMNVVISQRQGNYGLVEVQGTAEKGTFSQEQLVQLSGMAMSAAPSLFQKQQDALISVPWIKAL